PDDRDHLLFRETTRGCDYTRETEISEFQNATLPADGMSAACKSGTSARPKAALRSEYTTRSCAVGPKRTRYAHYELSRTRSRHPSGFRTKEKGSRDAAAFAIPIAPDDHLG